jgi:CRP-like cAMP-binding protein
MPTPVPPTTLEFLSANDWALIQSKGRVATFPSGQSLIRAAHPVQYLYILTKGAAQVLVQGKAIAALRQGAICGEMSFIEGTVASASVVADGELEALELPAAELRELFEAFPHLGLRFYRSIAITLSKRLRATSQQLAGKNGQP